MMDESPIVLLTRKKVLQAAEIKARVQNLKTVIDRPTRLPLVLMMKRIRIDESSGVSYYGNEQTPKFHFLFYIITFQAHTEGVK